MTKATDNFKSDPYVKDYYQKAQENQAIMNGMADQPRLLPANRPRQRCLRLPTPTSWQLPVDSDSLSTCE